MAERPPRPDSHDNDTSSTPRWVKVFAIIIIVLLLLFVIMHLAGGGFRTHTAPGAV
jgi:hypothetical protein